MSLQTGRGQVLGENGWRLDSSGRSIVDLSFQKGPKIMLTKEMSICFLHDFTGISTVKRKFQSIRVYSCKPLHDI